MSEWIDKPPLFMTGKLTNKEWMIFISQIVEK
jgi:hypothetical protein